MVQGTIKFKNTFVILNRYSEEVTQNMKLKIKYNIIYIISLQIIDHETDRMYSNASEAAERSADFLLVQ